MMNVEGEGFTLDSSDTSLYLSDDMGGADEVGEADDNGIDQEKEVEPSETNRGSLTRLRFAPPPRAPPLQVEYPTDESSRSLCRTPSRTPPMIPISVAEYGDGAMYHHHHSHPHHSSMGFYGNVTNMAPLVKTDSFRSMTRTPPIVPARNVVQLPHYVDQGVVAVQPNRPHLHRHSPFDPHFLQKEVPPPQQHPAPGLPPPPPEPNLSEAKKKAGDDHNDFVPLTVDLPESVCTSLRSLGSMIEDEEGSCHSYNNKSMVGSHTETVGSFSPTGSRQTHTFSELTQQAFSSQKPITILLIVAIILLVIVVVLVVVLWLTMASSSLGGTEPQNSLAPSIAPVFVSVGSRAPFPRPVPVAPSIAPSKAYDPLREFLSTNVALQGGQEFEDSSTYQSKALAFLQTLALASNEEYVPYYALACVYYSTYGVPTSLGEASSLSLLPGWQASSGWVTKDKPVCGWWGVWCDNKAIFRLDLSSNRLIGTLASEIQLLAPSLRSLDLSSNPLLKSANEDGTEWMGKLTNLVDLTIRSTALQHNGVPVYLGNLSKLEILDISDSGFSNGPIRGEAFGGLASLLSLTMGGNVFTSTIPSELYRLPSLQLLSLNRVVFTGVEQNVSFLSQMPSIVAFTLDDAVMNSHTIPTEIGLVKPTLAILSMTSSYLTGSIPTEIGSLTGIKGLGLSGNQLVGTIPAVLGNLTSLEWLSLENTTVVGSMPSSVCMLRSPTGALSRLGMDCDGTTEGRCSCCTCCGVVDCGR